MRTWLSLFLFPILAWGECAFNESVGSIYSLSGPITTAIGAIGLNDSSQLKGISSLYRSPEKNFQGEKIPGGSFLSPSTVGKFQGGVVFFDESQETEKILRSFGRKLQLKKISTRNLIPEKVTSLVVSELKHVTVGCEQKLRSFQENLDSLQKEILQKIPSKLQIVFFLGGFTGVSYPDLVMANDGFVKWLRDQERIKTYPTDLAYVPWSAKIMKGHLKNAFEIGLVDASETECKSHSRRKFTCSFPRALTPGIDQLRALRFILDQI